jgi:hypothetical protein
VLRATDIIPPFDKIPAPADAGGAELESPELAAMQTERAESSVDSDQDADCGQANPAGQESEPSPATDGEIPKYDLAENILAEQRRVAARRRRAPSQAEDEPPVMSELNGSSVSEPELPSEDLPELQRIVAEIVARDIERLCRRPDTD